MGTPDFAVPPLSSLINNERFQLISCFTNPDKKIGRKRILSPSPVKIRALEAGIDIYQPERIKDSIEIIEKLAPDLIVVVAYGHIIPESILKIPRFGCINIHGSLLPKYRGAACVQAAIINQEKEAGITIMLMDKGLDTGPIIHQASIRLNSTEVANEVMKKLSSLAAELLPDVLLRYISAELTPVPQDESLATKVGLIKKSDGLVNWQERADQINAKFRALTPWPGLYTELDAQVIKIHELGETIDQVDNKAGSIKIIKNHIFVQCGDRAIRIKKLQEAGRKVLSDKDFLNSHLNLDSKSFK